MNWIFRMLVLALLGVEVASWYGFGLPVTPDFSWLGLVATAIGIWLLVELLRLPWGLRLVVFLELMLDAASDMFNIYSRYNSWDQFMHFAGGAVASAVAIWVLRELVKRGELSFSNIAAGIFIGAVLITAVAGILYEVQEYLTDVYYLHYQKQLGDGPDTVDDLLFNILGASVIAGAYALAARRRKN